MIGCFLKSIHSSYWDLCKLPVPTEVAPVEELLLAQDHVPFSGWTLSSDQLVGV